MFQHPSSKVHATKTDTFQQTHRWPPKLVRKLLNELNPIASGKKWPLQLNRWTLIATSYKATPMNFALIDTTSHSTGHPKMDALELNSGKNSALEPSEFGQVIGDLLNPKPLSSSNLLEQPLANVADMANMANMANMASIPNMANIARDTDVLLGFSMALGSDALKAVHLGPHLNVITAETAVPDVQSLEAFARSQGLDETVVQWLLGSGPISAPQNPGLGIKNLEQLTRPVVQGAVNDLTLNTNVPQAEALPGTDLTSQSTAIFSEGLGQLKSLPPQNAVHHLSPNVIEPALGASAALLPEEVVDPLIQKSPNAVPVIRSDSQNQNLPLNASVLLALAQQTEQARQQPSTQEVATEATKVQIQVMPAPTPAAVWMMRNTLAVTAPKQEQFQKSGISWSELDLTDAASPQLLESLEQAMAEGGSSAPSSASSPLLASTGTPAGQRPDLSVAARQDLQTQAGGPGTEDAGPAQRSENIQNLAEKMGQAVGQRILSEIEKGQWHLKLSLRPATLGHIEVEMRMRSGELDAVFTAPQAVTRELLQDGLSKLKDTLNQMGMDVASMLVGDGQKQKRGGDSTPEQMSKSKNDNSVDSGSSPLTGSAPIHHMKMGQDGWDVLV